MDSNATPTPSDAQIKLKQDTNDQIRRLGEKIEKAILPKDLKDNLISRIQRLALLRASAGFLSANYILEYESTASYVNWAVGLPWNNKSQDVLDLNMAKKILDKNHYGMQNIKDRILEYLALIMLNLKQGFYITKAPILCFVGLPGTGKTTFAASVAQVLGRRFERIPFGGMGDARALRGQSRAFPDAEPGYIVKRLSHAQTKNCVILLDELDRISSDARSDVMGVLVELLDSEQNMNFTDHYIDFPFDLSEVLFIATANNTTNISNAVLDRLEIIQMPSYTDEEKIIIGRDYLFPKTREETGLLANQLTIDPNLWPFIIRPLGFDSGIRSLGRTIDGICRKTARLIVEGKIQSITINSTNIKEFLPQI
ncbi:AAA family ATPase [Patescibacteria group bacterium]|nr:AAA family ATPase [Patescibacteria group bacterium]MCL5009995.1 AAA family ATPase [Patescibacteria group bacterium]